MATQTLERPTRTPAVDLDALFPGRFLSVTSFKRDGTGVATPLWFVSDGRRLFALTDLHSGKVRRVRRTPDVLVAPCRPDGKLRSRPIPARADVLTAPAELDRVQRLLLRRYKLSYRLVMAGYRLGRRARGRRGVADGAALALTVGPVPADLQRTPRPAAHAETWSTQARWLAAAAVLGFLVPFVFSSLLELQHDVYLGVYFAAVLGFLGAYVSRTGLDVRATVSRQWRLGVALGALFGVLLVRNVLTEDATSRPDGAYFVFELVWRGGIYGAVDALLLTVLPCLVIYRALGGRLATWRRRLTYFAASLALVVGMTAVYHLGYEQYRQDGVGAPEVGNTLISMPMLLSTNPIGSVADHMAMHVSAVAHEYETEVRLPPPTDAD